MSLTPVERLALLDEPDQLYVLRRLTMPEKRGLLAHYWWHKGQKVPDGDWRICLGLGGRGFGKTWGGAQWVSALARADGTLRIALVGASRREVLEVMVRGPSGLMAVAHADEDLVCYSGCAAFSIISPGATSSPNGAIRRRPGTICCSACGSAKAPRCW